MPRVHIYPSVDPTQADPGDGGIGRVVRGQLASLPDFGWEVVATPEEADLIACHVEIPPTYLRLHGDKPFVTHLHGAYWTDGGYEWEQWSYITNQKLMAALRASDAVTSVSEWTAQSFRRNSLRDVRVIVHGVDTDEWTPPEAHLAYILWNKTRVDPICDPAPVNAVARLLPNRQFVTTFGTAAANVDVTGKMTYEDGKSLVRAAGVYLATTRETFGIGTLEAMAAGVPIVGFDFGGQREFIEHGVDGWLVRPGDIDGLAEGIEWALANRAEVGQRAREKAMQFPVERASRAYAELYDEVLARHRAEREPGRPRVSVIVPVYNMGDYLDDTLRSIAAQDTDDWECIVVNDASPDIRDSEITARWISANPRFREIVLTENGYLANARNVGIAAARGRYIFPLDADDQMTPITLGTLANALDRDHALHIAYGNVLFTVADGRTLAVYREARERGIADGHSGWPIPFNLEWMLHGPGQLLPYASMFRRTVWEQTGGYRVRSRSSEDQDFWLRATSYGFTAAMVTEADTLIYRVRPDSMSSSRGAGWEEHRGWFPWADIEQPNGQRGGGNRALIPGGAVQETKPPDALPLPAFDPAPIAVVIPVGPGHAKYLIDAIDSVDSQTFRNWECIVANDSGGPLPALPSWVRVVEGPPCEPCHASGQQAVVGLDEEAAMYRRWAACSACGGTGRARFGGVAAARNAAIRATRAAFFLPLDADDYLQPRCLELMWENAISGTEPAVIYSDFWEDPDEPGKFRVWETPDYDPWHLIRRGTLHAVTALTPRSFWLAVGGYDEGLAWEDWALSIAIAAKGWCSRRIALPLFTYRKHTGMRRNDAHADFETSKAAIMAKDFGLTKGGELLACQSCGSGRATTSGFNQPFQQPGAGSMAMQVPEDAVLVRYTGPREGTFRFKSGVNPSISYAFSKTRADGYVHKLDADDILRRPDFMLIDRATVAVAQELRSGPALVAEREPAMAGATAGAPGAGPWGMSAPMPQPEAPPQPAATPAPSVTPLAAVAPGRELPPMPTAVDRPLNETEIGLLNANTREALNAIAVDLGIENAAELRTKEAVVKAISAVRSARGQ